MDLTRSDKNIQKVLLVGAGGVGCELLKNISLYNGTLQTSRLDVTVVDLDTISVSNLNRQFLFQQKDVGKTKCGVGVESIDKMRPGCRTNFHPIVANIITEPSFTLDFYKQFDVVLNALDNIEARKHVNSMCLLADVIMIDTGSTGHSGNTDLVYKGKRPCYLCYKTLPQKTYAICTIRNSPSKPVHCVVWARHLFNQLFNANATESNVLLSESGTSVQQSMVDLVSNGNFDAIFKLVFVDDINDVARMIQGSSTSTISNGHSSSAQIIPILPIAVTPDIIESNPEVAELYNVFMSSAAEIFAVQKSCGIDSLQFDKDDQLLVGFVTAVANLRMWCFHITPRISTFECQSIAGNIIPAVASTNAMVAGFAAIEMRKTLMRRRATRNVTSLNKDDDFERLGSTDVYLDGGNDEDKLPIKSNNTAEPNAECQTCQQARAINIIQLFVDFDKHGFAQVAERLRGAPHSFSDPEIMDMRGNALFGEDVDEASALEPMRGYFTRRRPSTGAGDATQTAATNTLQVLAEDFNASGAEKALVLLTHRAELSNGHHPVKRRADDDVQEETQLKIPRAVTE